MIADYDFHTKSVRKMVMIPNKGALAGALVSNHQRKGRFVAPCGGKKASYPDFRFENEGIPKLKTTKRTDTQRPTQGSHAARTTTSGFLGARRAQIAPCWSALGRHQRRSTDALRQYVDSISLCSPFFSGACPRRGTLRTHPKEKNGFCPQTGAPKATFHHMGKSQPRSLPKSRGGGTSQSWKNNLRKPVRAHITCAQITAQLVAICLEESRF